MVANHGPVDCLYFVANQSEAVTETERKQLMRVETGHVDRTENPAETGLRVSSGSHFLAGGQNGRS